MNRLYTPYRTYDFRLDNHRVYILYYGTVTSTQDIAKNIAEKHALGKSYEYVIVVADSMTKGRGRMGRKWFADKGGVWFSVAVKPSIEVKNFTLYSILAGLSVAKTVDKICGIKPCIKWPNDILIKDKKLSGILVEASISQNKVNRVIIGIGLNLNNKIRAELADKAISLSEIGCNTSRDSIVLNFLEFFDYFHNIYLKDKIDIILKECKIFCCTLGKEVRVITSDKKVIYGKALSIDLDGSLIILKKNGDIYRVTYEEIYHLR